MSGSFCYIFSYIRTWRRPDFLHYLIRNLMFENFTKINPFSNFLLCRTQKYQSWTKNVLSAQCTNNKLLFFTYYGFGKRSTQTQTLLLYARKQGGQKNEPNELRLSTSQQPTSIQLNPANIPNVPTATRQCLFH